MATELVNLDPPGAVATWRITDDALASPGATWRSLLSAIVESCPESPVTQRWRERAWLGSTRDLDELDRLTSGLVYARSAAVPTLDPHVVIHDLRELRSLLCVDAMAPCVLCVDDAEPLAEDVGLLECLVDALDASGWTLALAGRPAAARHLVEARSTLVRRIRAIRLRPLALHEVERCLDAGGLLADRLPKDVERRYELVRSVARLAGGSPLLVSHVAQAMHQQAEVLRLEELELTLPVLRATLAGVQALRFRDDDLLPLTRLSAQNLELALSVVPYERFTLEQIARARCLGVRGAEDLCRSSVADESELAAAVARVASEVEVLSELGVVRPDRATGRFTTAGGMAAHVLYETSSRELLDRTTTPLPFGSDFTSLVGVALERTLFDRVRTDRGAAVCVFRTAARGASEYSNEQLRPVIEALEDGRTPDLGRLYLVPESPKAREVLTTIVRRREGALLLFSGTVRSDEGELEYAEVWATAEPGDGFEGLHAGLMDEHASLQGHFAFAGLTSGGCSATARRATDAAGLACSLFPAAAHEAIGDAYGEGERELARELAELALEAVSNQGVVEPFERADELGMLRNRLGFLSLLDGRASEAEELFRQVLKWSAKNADNASAWLYEWNLAQALLAQDRRDEAEGVLRRAEDVASEGGARNVYLLCSSEQVSLVPLFLDGAFDQDVLRALIRAQREAITGATSVAELSTAETKQVADMGRALLDAENAA